MASPIARTAPRSGDIAVLGTAPGGWLAIREGGGNGFAAALAHDLAGLASVSDQSDGYAVFRLVGARVPDALAKGTSVDLHPRAFPAGRDVAVTSAAHMGMILWRLDDAAASGHPVFELAVFRSYAEGFARWLSASAAEFGLAAG